METYLLVYVNMGPPKSSYLLPPTCHVCILGAQQWIRWCVCLEGDSPREMGKQTLKYNLPLVVRDVPGLLYVAHSFGCSALKRVFLENRPDLPRDLRQAPPHASL